MRVPDSGNRPSVPGSAVDFLCCRLDFQPRGSSQFRPHSGGAPGSSRSVSEDQLGVPGT